MNKGIVVAVAIVLSFSSVGLTFAQQKTATSELKVNLTIASECTVNSTEGVNFAPQGLLRENVDGTGSITVTCSRDLPYSIGLGAGKNSVTTERQMINAGGATIGYQLFSDSARLKHWGDSVADRFTPERGNGAPQKLTVYGRVLSKTIAPAVGSYEDTVQVTVYY